MKTAQCIVCKSNNVVATHIVRDYRLNDHSVQYHYDKCLNCGLIFQNPQVSFTAIVNHYNQHVIYKSIDSIKGLNRILYNHGLHKRASVILKKKTNGKLLDVGCGSGAFIEYIGRFSKIKAIGTEINLENVKRLRCEKGLDVRFGNLSDINFLEREFDIITLWDVIEHVNDPNQTLAEIRKLLKPDGFLIIRVPNGDSLDFKLFGKYWAGLDAPRHFYVFSKESLSRIFKMHGFNIISYHYHIGGYLNFINSLEFFLNDTNVPSYLRKLLLKILRNQILQIVFSPFLWVSNLFHLGTSMTITACPNGN